MKKTYYIILYIFMMLMLSSCAPSSIPKINAQYYPQCIQPLVKMQISDTHITQATIKTAIFGAIGGAIVGFATSGDAVGALAGAAIGASTGAIVGYSFSKINQISDENTRFASIRITANQDLSNANRLQIYSYECIMCYMREFEILQTSYKNGNIVKYEYAMRFAEIKNAMVELGKIIGNMDTEISRTEREFTATLSRPTEISSLVPKPAVVSEIRRKPSQQKNHRKACLSDILAEKRAHIEQAQEKNEADLSIMIDDFAGKPHPPKQDIQAIKQNYGQKYAEARQQIEDLRHTYSEVMAIMDKAAIEAGIDMV